VRPAEVPSDERGVGGGEVLGDARGLLAGQERERGVVVEGRVDRLPCRLEGVLDEQELVELARGEEPA